MYNFQIPGDKDVFHSLPIVNYIMADTVVLCSHTANTEICDFLLNTTGPKGQTETWTSRKGPATIETE